MNKELRQKLENLVAEKSVKLKLRYFESVHGYSMLVERELLVSSLTDKELSCLSSDLKWGKTKGLLMDNEGRNCSVHWNL